MGFESITAEPFQHAHESTQFEKLAKVLNERFGSREGEHLLIGNCMCNREELDAVFIKPDAFCVIEMKSISGAVRFTENGPWYCDGSPIRSGRHINPFRQAKTYRYEVIRKLGNWQSEGALQPRNDKPWGHVSAAVLFDQSFELEGRIPPGIDAWFHIADLRRAADCFESLSSPLIEFNRYDFNHFREHLGGERSGKAEFTPEGRTRFIYDRSSDIPDMLRSLRRLGGSSLRAATRFEEAAKEANAGGIPFSDWDRVSVDEIKDAWRYRFMDGHSIVAITHENFLCPVAIGRDEEVDEWVIKNRGASYVIDRNGKVSFTYVGGKGGDKVSVSEENIPLLSRIEIDLATLVPQALVRKHLLTIVETSSDAVIEEVLEAVYDENVKGLLSDIIHRLLSGDLDGAKARLDLWNGDAVEIADIVSPDAEIIPDRNSDKFVDVEALDPEELEKLFDPERFAEWMIFLHPEQRRIAHADFGRRALLTGVSGSGKTCVLVHRARHLAKKYPDEKIAILTLNRSLSRLIDNLVSQLCGERERKNIRVLAFYDYFQQMVNHFTPAKEVENLKRLASKDPESGTEIIKTLNRVDHLTYARDFDPLSGETVDDAWEIFLEQPVVRTALTYYSETMFKQDPKIDHLAYLREEFSLIRSGCLTASRKDEYLGLKREGRAIPLQPKDRELVLKMLLLFEESMIHGGLIDELGLTLAVTPHISDLAKLPDELKYRCLLIDEFQDLSTRDLAVLQMTVPQAENALFLTGDMVQQVMVKTLSLPKVGFLPGSYDREHIVKNYRNSRNILLAANDLILDYGRIARDQNEELEILDPEFAIRETSWPRAVEAHDEIEAAWQRAADCLSGGDAAPWSVCIVTTCPSVYPVKTILERRPADFPVNAEKLTGDYAESPETMTVGTMSGVKGFEFSVMIVIGCGEKCLPNPGRTSDEAWRDALRLYVAMTRARDQVIMIYSGEASEVLTVMNEHIEWETLEG